MLRILTWCFKSTMSLSDNLSQESKSIIPESIQEDLLDLNTSVILANALVSSRLDLFNTLFVVLTDFEIRRLHSVYTSPLQG